MLRLGAAPAAWTQRQNRDDIKSNIPSNLIVDMDLFAVTKQTPSHGRDHFAVKKRLSGEMKSDVVHIFASIVVPKRTGLAQIEEEKESGEALSLVARRILSV